MKTCRKWCFSLLETLFKPLDRLEWELLIVYSAKRQVRDGLQNRVVRQEHCSELKSELFEKARFDPEDRILQDQSNENSRLAVPHVRRLWPRRACERLEILSPPSYSKSLVSRTARWLPLLTGLTFGIVDGTGLHGLRCVDAIYLNRARLAFGFHPLGLDAMPIHIQSRFLDLSGCQTSQVVGRFESLGPSQLIHRVDRLAIRFGKVQIE